MQKSQALKIECALENESESFALIWCFRFPLPARLQRKFNHFQVRCKRGRRRAIKRADHTHVSNTVCVCVCVCVNSKTHTFNWSPFLLLLLPENRISPLFSLHVSVITTILLFVVVARSWQKGGDSVKTDTLFYSPQNLQNKIKLCFS